MNLTNTPGSYLPSFLRIKIGVEADFSNIRHLPDEVKALFFHEYTHFIQNLTTQYGLTTLWNTFDRIRHIIALAQKKKVELTLPLNDPELALELKHFKIIQAIKGDSNIHNTSWGNGTHKVLHLKLEINPFLLELQPDQDIRLVKLILENNFGETREYSFGATAVEESMAYLLEKKFYNFHNPPDYPYNAAKLLAEYVCPKMALNEEFLFAICDAALSSSYPGLLFYLCLLEISQRDFNPKSSIELHQFCINVIQERGWNIYDYFEQSKNALLRILDTLYQGEYIEHTREWFKYLIIHAHNLRTTNPVFMIELYNSEDTFSGPWEVFVFRMGFPEMVDLNNLRFFSAPIPLKGIENKIEPIFLIAISQLHDTLLIKSTKCKLEEVCLASNQKEYVNDNCRNAPWNKCSEEQLCAFAALWTNYGLNEKEIII